MKKDIKKWCQEKKGREWFNKNKFEVGFSLGAMAFVAGCLIADKIFEPKLAALSFLHLENDDGSWDDDFGVQTYGIDRFGRKLDGQIVRFEQKDAEWIADHAHKIVNDINEHNKNL